MAIRASQAIGPDYLEQAFLAAREALDRHPEWDVKLYYNDYNEDNQNKATAIANMVEEINGNYAKAHPGRLLIDGVGMQGHYNIHTNPANVELSLEQFIALGVEVSITELDIQAGSDYRLSEQLANTQGYLYAQLMDLFSAHADHIKRVTFWGMDDGTSWRASTNPLLFDKDLQAKPAYDGVIDPAAFLAAHQPETRAAKRSIAPFGTPVIDGTVDPVWRNAPELPVNRFQTAWQGATGTAKALWDDENLYVLIQVSDEQLDKASPNAWEQDSIEIFVDEDNQKTTFYQADDGQYRVNFDNETSFNPEGIAEGFESAAKAAGTGYTVEVKIPFKHVTPANQLQVGFDAQVNDGKDGARQSVAAWNDTTGTGYMDPSAFGVLTLTSSLSFGDTASVVWAIDSIEALAARGIVSGVAENAFAPNRPVTRAEFTRMIVGALDLPQAGATSTFTDVRQGEWYYDAIASAQQLGIVDGLPNGSFGWNDPISRQEMAAMAYRVLAQAGVALQAGQIEATFADSGSIAAYAQEAIRALHEAGALNGRGDGAFDPQGTATRAEAAVMLYRMLSL